MATIGSPRFLWPLVRRGVVSDIEVALYDADVEPVRMRRLVIELHQVKVSRRRLLRGQVHLDDLGDGRVEVELDGPAVAEAVGLPLTFHDDEVEIRQSVGPVAVATRGALSVEGDLLTFRPGSVQGLPLLVSVDFEFRLPTSPLWPRAAEVRAIEGGLLVSCDLDDVPPGLIDPAPSR